MLMPERVDTATDKNYTKGESFESSVFPVTDDIEEITVSIERALIANITDRDIVGCTLMASFDEGKTFIKWGGMTIAGGEIIGRKGNIIPFSHFNVTLPLATNRKLKVFIDAKEDTHIKLDVDQLFKAG